MELNKINNQQINFENLTKEENLNENLSGINLIERNKLYENMGLKQNLLRGIFCYGLKTPSTIERRAIIPLIQKRDIFFQYEFGLGKIYSYIIGMFQNINTQNLSLQAMIIVPKRETAQSL